MWKVKAAFGGDQTGLTAQSATPRAPDGGAQAQACGGHGCGLGGLGQLGACTAHTVGRYGGWSVVGNVTPKRRVEVLMCGGVWRAGRGGLRKGTRTEFNLAAEP